MKEGTTLNCHVEYLSNINKHVYILEYKRKRMRPSLISKLYLKGYGIEGVWYKNRVWYRGCYVEGVCGTEGCSIGGMVGIEQMMGSKESSCSIYTRTSESSEMLSLAGNALISPVVRFQTLEYSGDASPQGHRYKVTIPHCLPRSYNPSSIKLRYGDIYKGTLRELKLDRPQEGFKNFYEVLDNNIVVYVNHFCDVVCTSTEKICTSNILALPFGLIKTFDSEEQTNVKVKIFLCSILYSSTTLQKVR